VVEHEVCGLIQLLILELHHLGFSVVAELLQNPVVASVADENVFVFVVFEVS